MTNRPRTRTIHGIQFVRVGPGWTFASTDTYYDVVFDEHDRSWVLQSLGQKPMGLSTLSAVAREIKRREGWS